MRCWSDLKVSESDCRDVDDEWHDWAWDYVEGWRTGGKGGRTKGKVVNLAPLIYQKLPLWENREHSTTPKAGVEASTAERAPKHVGLPSFWV